MTTFPSTAPTGISSFLTSRFQVAQSASLSNPLVAMTVVAPAKLVTPPPTTMLLYSGGPVPGPPPGTIGSVLPAGVGDAWFDRIHVIPRSIVLGNILTLTSVTIDIYNAYLYQDHYLQAFTNNAGDGTSVVNTFTITSTGSTVVTPGFPTLPALLPAQRSLLMTFQATADGAPVIDSTLDFDTSEPYLITVPITGTRVVVFPFEPEAPLTERLIFLTDVFVAIDGTEQRVSNRTAPRQEFDLVLIREDGNERQKVDNLLFDWQSRVFGVPIWTEPAYLTSAAAAAATSLNVNSTTLSDFRSDGLLIVFESEDKFDTVEIDSIGPTSINLSNGLVNSYPIGTRVMPIRLMVTNAPASEKKYAVNLAEFALTMKVLDNDVDLSDLTGWPTHASKVLLSDPNAIEETLDGTIERQITVFDGAGTGKFSQASTWTRAKHNTKKTFISTSRSSLWAIRKLLHALRGKQVSFFLPTFTKDVTLAATYASGGSALTVSNTGYTRYAKQRSPKVDIRITLTDGTVFDRTITASSEINAATEQLTLSSSIAQTIPVASVARIEFLEKVRIDSDTITIQHQNAIGQAKISFPVKGVFE